MSPASAPRGKALRSGKAVINARAVSRRASRSSIERVPRTLLAISVVTDESTSAMIASATNTSMSVKPAQGSFGVDASGARDRDNVDASGQPVDPNLEAAAGAGEGDDPAA